VGVVHEQYIGFEDDTAFETNIIFSSYRAPCTDLAVIFDDYLQLVGALHAERQPTVFPDPDPIPQRHARYDAAGDLTRVV
jgi:hypothetical protein